MADTWITDITHFLDEKGELISEPPRAWKLGEYLAVSRVRESLPSAPLRVVTTGTGLGGADWMRIFKLWVLILVLVLTSGCAFTRTGIASLKSTSHFTKLDSDSRILYEPGAEALARQVGRSLPTAIAAVENEQFLPYAKEVQVYVCTSQESFEGFTGQKGARGTVTSKLFLSGRLKEEPEKIASYLTHELSHLHILQHLGFYRYNSDMPPWFVEGLAVEVSGGGGADKVREADAAKSILAGKNFVPGTSGGFFFRKYGIAFGLEPHMFYRQSGMFVKYLRKSNKDGFNKFMLAIFNGKSFEEAFSMAYHTKLNDEWGKFVELLFKQYS